MNLLYRARQFWRLLMAAPLTPVEQQDVQALLSPTAYELFQTYSYGDQWHSYRVMCLLREAGYDHHDLLTAALLHDVGKTKVRFTAIDRTFVSLVRKLFPQLVERLEMREWGQANSWQRLFLVSVHHPAWSAEIATAAGCTPLSVSLMRRHQDPLTYIVTEEDQLLAYLQWADNQN